MQLAHADTLGTHPGINFHWTVDLVGTVLHSENHAFIIIAKSLRAKLVVVTNEMESRERNAKQQNEKVNWTQDVRYASCGLKPGLKQLLGKPRVDWILWRVYLSTVSTLLPIRTWLHSEIWSLDSCRYVAAPQQFEPRSILHCIPSGAHSWISRASHVISYPGDMD